jgi:hypothetical protein
MTSPIILGVIAEINNKLPLARVVAMSVALCEAIYNDEDEIDDDMEVCAGLTIGDVREYGDFWESTAHLHSVIASLLESETQRIANPILAAYPDTTADDLFLVVSCTDDLQIAAFAEVQERCRQMWNKPVVKRSADGSEDGFWTFFTNRY